jgi:hypothetical protein
LGKYADCLTYCLAQRSSLLRGKVIGSRLLRVDANGFKTTKETLMFIDNSIYLYRPGGTAILQDSERKAHNVFMFPGDCLHKQVDKLSRLPAAEPVL